MLGSTLLTTYYHNAYQNSNYNLHPESRGECEVFVTAGLYTAIVTTVTDVDGKGVSTCKRWESIVGN